MSLFKRKDSSCWWVKIVIDGRKIQRSTGTDDKIKAQEFHDRLKAQMWEQNRLGLKPRRSWKEAVVRWLEETSEKATHEEDRRKLIWLARSHDKEDLCLRRVSQPGRVRDAESIGLNRPNQPDVGRLSLSGGNPVPEDDSQ